MKTAKVILSGGSAYGLAHIGVLKAIQEQYEITGIVGTSMGAIIGALAACNIPTSQMLDWAENLPIMELFNPMNLDFSLSGIFDGKKVKKLFETWTDFADIESASIPYLAIAYDLKYCLSIMFDKGSFADAMRASCSLPYIFAPHEIGGYAFVDGGVTHPLPLAFAQRVPGEICIAVNVLPPVNMQIQSYTPQANPRKHKLIRHNILMQSLMQNQGFIAIQAMLQYSPDIYIDAHLSTLKFTDLKKAREFYRHGYKQATQSLDEHKTPDFAKKLHDKYSDLVSKISILKPDFFRL